MGKRMGLEITEHDKAGFFASANTAEGFHSDFDKVFGGLRKLYILKGGPGCGKSSFMEAVAKAAEGRGISAERFYCSSDPDSMDGILLTEMSVGILDGTAPHTTDPRYPGAVEEIVNLGAFWESGALEEQREGIITLGKQKNAAYQSGLRLLSAAGTVRREQLLGAERGLLREKMAVAAERFLRAEPKGNGREEIRGIEAIGMKGKVRYRGLERQAGQVWRISEGSGEYGELFLGELLGRCRAEKIDRVVSFAPLSPSLPNAVFLPGSRRLVIAGGRPGGADRLLHMKRFLSQSALREQAEVQKNLRAALAQLEKGVADQFSKAKTCHFALEGIYGAAMDFAAKEVFTAAFIRDLF